MKKLFALLPAALILAACTAVPTPQGHAPLRSVTLSAANVAPFRAQGIGSGLPMLTMTVRVRTSTGSAVHFKDGTTYDPTGTGPTTITLSADTNYARAVLLPAGIYQFEVAGKDATDTALLTYGPYTENAATVSDTPRVVRLTAHSVMSPDDTTLDPTLPLATLYTDTHFTLGLRPHTATVDGDRGVVPTADIGPVTYTVGAPTDGDLTLPGSKLGVQVTARGSASDAELNVSATFNAWVRVPGTDTATFTPVTVTYAKPIVTSVLTADLTIPVVSLVAPTGASRGQATSISGTVSDDTRVQAVRVYDDTTLIASTDPTDSVTPLLLASDGTWTLSWMPERTGVHTLSVIAADDSGNEARQDRTVDVVETPPGQLDVPSDGNVYSNVYDLQAGVPRSFTITVHDNPSGYSFLAFFNPGECGAGCPPGAPKQFTTDLRDADGTVVPLVSALYGGNEYDFTNENVAAGLYTVTVTPSADTQVSLYGVRSPN